MIYISCSLKNIIRQFPWLINDYWVGCNIFDTFVTNCYTFSHCKMTQLYAKRIFEKKVCLSRPRSPFSSPAPLNESSFYILCSGGHKNLVFTSSDVKCPSLYPTSEDATVYL